jgi:D-alanyl-lipoteichoic acid acyltransferase DltB (MBOAT superfamily)
MGAETRIVLTINSLRPSGNYMNHLLRQLLMLHFVFIGFAWFSPETAIISLNSINQLIFVMVKCDVLFEIRTELLNKM